PAAFSRGTSVRKPNSEPNSPGIRTTGWPTPEVSTSSDAVAASGTLKVRASALSLSSATARSQTMIPPGAIRSGGIYLGRARFAGGRAPDPRPLSGAGRAGGVRARRPARGAQGAAGDGE